ncbi:MAG: hypothetical protein WC707_05810 [Candidatus Babeliaceae bacterium]|jgi:hypothetical protein
MHRSNKITQILIRFENKFNKKTIATFFSNISLILDEIEYFFSEQKNNFTAEEFIANTLSETSREIRLMWGETGVDLGFYHGTNDEFSLFISRFANYLEANVGCPAGESMLDVGQYLTILCGLCEDLVIKYIEVEEDIENDFKLLPKPIPNTLAASLGCTYSDDGKTFYDYLKIIANNLFNSGNAHFKNVEHIETNQIIEAVQKEDFAFDCSWQGYDVNIHLMKFYVIITPINNIKYKTIERAQVIDSAFYTRLFVEACKGIGIREFKTYFNRPD